MRSVSVSQVVVFVLWVQSATWCCVWDVITGGTNVQRLHWLERENWLLWTAGVCRRDRWNLKHTKYFWLLRNKRHTSSFYISSSNYCLVEASSRDFLHQVLLKVHEPYVSRTKILTLVENSLFSPSWVKSNTNTLQLGVKKMNTAFKKQNVQSQEGS